MRRGCISKFQRIFQRTFQRVFQRVFHCETNKMTSLSVVRLRVVRGLACAMFLAWGVLVVGVAQDMQPGVATETTPQTQAQATDGAADTSTGDDAVQDDFAGTPLEATAEEQQETETLGNRIQRILVSIPAFEDLTATVTDGVVTLSGTVLSAAAREDALELVRSLENVVYVVSDITLETQVDKALSPVVLKIRDYWSNVIAFLPLAVVALVVIAAFWSLAWLLGKWQAPYRRFNVNPLLRSFLRQALRAAIVSVGLLLALDILGATPFVTAILGTAGVAGLAIGFAFKDIIENYLAGIIMSLRQPFRRSDFVKVGDQEGKVIRLTARELVLMTFDGNHVIIPNATVFTSELCNYTRNPRRRFDFVVGVDVEEDLTVVQNLGLETLEDLNGVLREPAPFAAIDALGDFNVLVHFYGWVDQRSADFLKVRSQAIRLVKEAFDRAGVLMPEPITNVRLKQVSADTPLVSASDDARPEPSRESDTRVSSDIKAEARGVDVSVDTSIDEQIESDEAVSKETNLLNEQASSPATPLEPSASKTTPQ